MTQKEIKQQLKPCLHCGRYKDIQVFHQDYNGDQYVGDEYCIECPCGISTGWYNANQIINIWNKQVKIYNLEIYDH